MVQQQTYISKIRPSSRSYISFSNKSETYVQKLLSELMPLRRIDSLIKIAKESPTRISTDILTAVTLEYTPSNEFNIIISASPSPLIGYR